MRPLRDLLVQVPVVYAHLGDALAPGRSGEPSDSSPDPRHRPAPARLEVTDHRHQLLRGLRWWVSKMEDTLADRPHTFGVQPATVADSVPRMCAWLLHTNSVMSPDSRTWLQTDLWEWVGAAMPLVGKVEAPTERVRLPAEALDRVVPVGVAAEVLGVSVRTVQRRAPERSGGVVRLRDVMPLCVHEVPVGYCGDCGVYAQELRTACVVS